MTFTVTGLFILLVLAAICGAIGRAIAGDIRGGIVVSIAVGFVGALLGPWLATKAGLPEPLLLQIAGQSFSIVWSIIGATIFVALVHLVARPR